jgi:hypothetical protein
MKFLLDRQLITTNGHVKGRGLARRANAQCKVFSRREKERKAQVHTGSLGNYEKQLIISSREIEEAFRVIARRAEETQDNYQWNQETIDILKKCRRMLPPVMLKESQDERPFMVNRLSINAI